MAILLVRRILRTLRKPPSPDDGLSFIRTACASGRVRLSLTLYLLPPAPQVVVAKPLRPRSARRPESVSKSTPARVWPERSLQLRWPAAACDAAEACEPPGESVIPELS